MAEDLTAERAWRWKGTIYPRRGHLYITFRDRHGKWRHRCTYLPDTPENRTAAQARIDEKKELARKAALRDAENARREKGWGGASERSAYKRERGAELSCEACGWRPKPPLNTRALNAHHIRPRAMGGPDVDANLIPLCPNCHALAHAIFGREDPGDRIALLTAIRSAA